jgi:hypothetical protein
VGRAWLALLLAGCTCEQPAAKGVPAPVVEPSRRIDLPPPPPPSKKMAGGVKPDRGRLPVVVEPVDQSRDK